MKLVFFNLLLCLHFLEGYGQQINQLRYEDKIRIREAKIINQKYGDLIWPGISQVPFTVLLVTDSLEFLIDHPNPSKDFQSLGYDNTLETEIHVRPTTFQTSFLATFPAVNGLSCIVVGTPENTGKTSSEWIITLLHEHFHQYQYDQKDYWEGVNSLNLANGDQSGMWMLNYDFPYKEEKVIKLFEKFTSNLHGLVSNLDEPIQKDQLSTYLKYRRKVQNSLDSSDYKYFSFQIWQEGIARYSEYKFLEYMENYEPSKDIHSLEDFTPFNKLKDDMLKRETQNVNRLKINDTKRVSFYAIGMAEGLILDKLNPNWRKNYFEQKFFIEKYLPESTK